MAGLFSGDTNDVLSSIAKERLSANQALGSPYGKYAGIVQTGAGLADIGADATAGGGVGASDPRMQQMKEVQGIFSQVAQKVGTTTSSAFYDELAKELQTKYPDQAQKAAEKAVEVKAAETKQQKAELDIKSIPAREASLRKLFPNMDETTVKAVAADEEGYRKLIANKYQPEKNHAPSEYAKLLDEAGVQEPQRSQMLQQYAQKKLQAANGDPVALKALEMMTKQVDLQLKQMQLTEKEQKQKDAEAAKGKKAIFDTQKATGVLTTIKEAKDLTSGWSAGVGSLASALPASDARSLSAKLNTIKANLGFDRLQQMREASPTGGALGQVAVQELEALQGTVATLDQGLSPAELKAALTKIEQHYNNWLDVMKQSDKGAGDSQGMSDADLINKYKPKG